MNTRSDCARRRRTSRLLPWALTVGTLSLIAAVGVLGVLSRGAELGAQSSPVLAPSRMEVDEPIGQGEEVRLPSLSVSNQGAEPATITIDLTSLADQEELAPDASWFRFDPAEFVLEPQSGQVVTVRMEIPEDAEVGDYRALLRARATPGDPAEGTGAVITAAVASTLLFSVENRNFHFYDPLVDFFQDRSPFSYLGVSLIGGVGILYLFQRRFSVRIGIGVERRD